MRAAAKASLQVCARASVEGDWKRVADNALVASVLFKEAKVLDPKGAR